MGLDNVHYVSLTVLVGVCTFAGALYLYQQSRRKRANQELGIVTKVIIYPIKSCKGIEVDEALCTPFGLKVGDLGDRQFITVHEETNEILTARQHPKLVLVEPSFNSELQVLTLNAPEMPEIKVKLKDVMNLPADCVTSIFDSETQGATCGQALSEWFSSYLGLKAKLLYFNPNNCHRNVEEPNGPEYTRQRRNQLAPVMYADGYPYLLCTEASVDAIGSEVKEVNVTLRNFRPNFLVSQTKGAYDEDNWRAIKVGKAEMFCEKPCGRCSLTTVDPNSGIKNKKAEPLNSLFRTRLLKQYNKRSPMFGMNLILDGKSQVVKVGDLITGHC